MEKLVLRGVMYGADKIPDSWFDRVPGGYYKSKGEEERQRHKSRRGDDSRRQPQGAQNAHHSGRNKSRGRRHSAEYDDRRPRYGGNPDRSNRARYDSDQQDRYGRSRSSYDGGDDYDPYFDDRDPNHPRFRRMAGRDDGYQPYADRYGYEDGRDQHSRRRQDDARDPPPLGNPHPPYPAGGSPAGRDYVPPVAAAAVAGVAAGAHASGHSRAAPAGNGASGGYVPYSNIYGGSQGRPSDSINGSVQPDSLNQVGAPVSPPGYGQQPYHDNRYYEDRDPEEFDTGYVPPSRVPRHRSPSYDSYDSRPRRARSERRRPNDSQARPKSRGKSLSRLRENFDTSQRGLGFGGVGALAGGVLGQEIGKGPIPTAIGAAIGGLGANAFGARERFVDPREPLPRDTRRPPPPPPAMRPEG